MNNWQNEFLTELLNGGIDYIKATIAMLEHHIKVADKRTYNGRTSAAFDRSRLLVANDALTAIGLINKPFEYVAALINEIRIVRNNPQMADIYCRELFKQYHAKAATVGGAK